MSESTPPRLGTLASRGAAQTLSGQLARLVVQFTGVVLLARLLAPTDYGLVAMVVSIIGIAEVVRDLGLSPAAVQAPTLSRQERDNLFWLNSALGAILTAATVAVGPLIAQLYDEPRLIALTTALSAVFLLNGLSAQYRAGLSRELRMGSLAVADVAGAASGLLAAVVVAFSGFGYWALAVQQLTQALVVLMIVVGAARWIPGGIHRRVTVRPFVRFGSGILLTQLLTYASRNVDSVVVGTAFGAQTLGTYNRAFELLMLPLNQLNAPASRVALPVLSKLQADHGRYGRFLLAGQTVLLQMILAVFSFAIALASPLVEIVLGLKWSAVVPIFEILAIGGVFQALTYVNYWVFMSRRLTRSMITWSIVTRPLLIVAVVFGSLWGVEGVAMAFTVANIAFWPLSLLWFARDPVIPTLRLFWLAARSLVVYSAVGIAAFSASMIASGSPWGALLWGALGWLIAFGLSLLVPVCRRDANVVLTVLRNSVAKGDS
ncbi:lipopolysaccharide biosynthesis protein [Agromyces sp. Marseille-Q5079]|uniref:lipopolysaccharide biosynthesis protein n=1 Tax=Agromyces sp. Marseille-Q5079 TaxID=3439059 RepID=UPI003D9CB998